MPEVDSERAARLFDDFIKLEWQDIFRTEVHVKLDSGARYVPNSGPRGVQLLRKGINAFHEAIRIWSDPSGKPDSGTQGYDRIVEQAGIQYTWEWFLIDPSRPWSGAVPGDVRDHIETDLRRRDGAAVARELQAAEQRESEALQEDDRIIAVMRKRRESAGLDSLTSRQEAEIRETRRRRRAP